jgi:hypothetical protein
MKWDYLTKNIEPSERGHLEKILDAYGAEGWELVQIYERKLIFKKPLVQKEKDKK